MKFLLCFLLFISVIACNHEDADIPGPDSRNIVFDVPQKVNVQNYDGEIMEPFLSRDGEVLFFNNLNNPSVNTNLHYAHKIDDLNFEYQGELKDVNTESLEGVPTLDASNKFYFVSTRSYDDTYSTIYEGVFENDKILNIHLVDGISKETAGCVNFDVEVSEDGNWLFFVDGEFGMFGGPNEANLVLAEKTTSGFVRTSNQSILQHINTDQLEYAACISTDLLELYFTRVEAPLSDSSQPQIFVATRDSVNEAFGMPYKIETISGFVEGPTISPDNQILYYHKKENGKHVLYMVRKK